MICNAHKSERIGTSDRLNCYAPHKSERIGTVDTLLICNAHKSEKIGTVDTLLICTAQTARESTPKNVPVMTERERMPW